MTGQLVRQILLRAVKEGVELAGAAVVGPAWPVLRAALSPVLERLTEKLGGEDPTSSREAAVKAADAFEQDPRLEELLRSNLALALQPVLDGQQRHDTNFEILYEIVNENREDIKSIKGQLDDGVRLDEETFDRLAEVTAERVAVMLEVRSFAQREADDADAVAPKAWLTRNEAVTDSQTLIAKAGQAEVEAVAQLGEGHLTRIVEDLEHWRGRLALALAETPSDVEMRLQYGYILKALGQATATTGDEAAADEWLERAWTVFQLALRDVPRNPVDRRDLASAANGLGNILAERGRDAQAVLLYREAVRLEPTYGYAWHDLFGSLLALASQGDFRGDDLDDAWNKLLAAAPGYPELTPAYLEKLRKHYDDVRKRSEHARGTEDD